MPANGEQHCSHDRGWAWDGVPVEVLAAPVVDRGGTRIRMAGRGLHVAKWHTCLEGSHDEHASQHAGVDQPEPARLPMERTKW